MKVDKHELLKQESNRTDSSVQSLRHVIGTDSDECALGEAEHTVPTLHPLEDTSTT